MATVILELIQDCVAIGDKSTLVPVNPNFHLVVTSLAHLHVFNLDSVSALGDSMVSTLLFGRKQADLAQLESGGVWLEDTHTHTLTQWQRRGS